jgi:putative tryptophan/tyrosine transport system substrate-binding protein
MNDVTHGVPAGSVPGTIVALLLCALVGALPLDTAAQPAQKPMRIGWVSQGAPGGDADRSRADFEQALRDLGRRVDIEYRYARGDVDRLPTLVGDLVRLQVDAIVTVGDAAALAAKQGTQSVPIIATEFAFDPVKAGLISSHGRPGGNVTGLASLGDELWRKRLGLLREIAPKVSRVAVLWNPANPGNRGCVGEIQAGAQSSGLQFKAFEVRDDKALERAFGDIVRERSDGLVACWDPVTLENARAIGDFAVRYRLPTIMPLREYVEAGALLSSGINLHAHRRRAAYYVDRILKGARPADLPIEQAAQFEQVVNVTTAQSIGLPLPGALLMLVDDTVTASIPPR